MAIPQQWLSQFNDLWSRPEAQPGSMWDMGSQFGNFKFGPQGQTATFTDPYGGSYNLIKGNPQQSLKNLWQSPYIKETWIYDTPTFDDAPTTTPANTGGLNTAFADINTIWDDVLSSGGNVNYGGHEYWQDPAGGGNMFYRGPLTGDRTFMINPTDPASGLNAMWQNQALRDYMAPKYGDLTSALGNAVLQSQANNPTITQPTNTVPATTPANVGQGGGVIDFTNIPAPYSYSGVDPEVRNALLQSIDYVKDMFPFYRQAQERLMGLPGEIDTWAQNQMKNYRVTNDDIRDAMSAVANARAGKGIMGGTENQNLRSNVMAAMAKNVADKKAAIQQQADAMKASAILGAPQTASIPWSTLANLLGQSRTSVQEDTAALPALMASIFQSNY